MALTLIGLLRTLLIYSTCQALTMYSWILYGLVGAPRGEGDAPSTTHQGRSASQSHERAQYLKNQLMQVKAQYDEEHGGLNNPVGSVVKLRGETHDQRKEEDKAALGGMRNPKRSVERVPGHAVIGRQVAAAIDDFMNEHPTIRDTIIKSIGVDKRHAPKIPDELLRDVRWRLAHVLDANLHRDTKRTELIAPLFEAWVAQSGDPDQPLVRWLFNGAPAGIESHPDNVGVFPPSEVPPSYDIDLTLADGINDTNYISMDGSPHAREVLDNLVNQNYIHRCSSLVEAIRYLKGERPILSKGALISKMKEGVLKHRLILDCRISGANSATLWLGAHSSPKGLGCCQRRNDI